MTTLLNIKDKFKVTSNGNLSVAGDTSLNGIVSIGNGNVMIDTNGNIIANTLTLTGEYILGEHNFSSDSSNSSISSQLIDISNTYAPINNPTFTGTVFGITAAMIGLGNINNTSDDNKPVSTAQATAISTSIANLVASSPETLNTLNELSTALGNDPNYATTLTNLIATKASLANPTFTETLRADNIIANKLLFSAINSNIPIGDEVLTENTSGDNNIAIGRYSLTYNTTGSHNIAIGLEVMKNNTIGNDNIAFGAYSFNKNTTGSKNIAIGPASLASNTTGEFNIAMGEEALIQNTTGGHNIALGKYSLHSNTTGSSNITLGLGSLQNNTTGSQNIGIGYNTLQYNINGEFNIAMGCNTLNENTSGKYNIGFGNLVLNHNTTGNRNIAFGDGSLLNNTTGNYNIALGSCTLISNRDGYNNIAIGYAALPSNTTGFENISIGTESLKTNSTGNYNVATGYYALEKNTTGIKNVAIGAYSMLFNTTGSNNVAIGYSSMTSQIAGINNVAIGNFASTYNYSNSICLGNRATATGDNQAIIGNSDVTTLIYGITTVSDKRDKYDIKDTSLGLAFINQLKPVDYKWDYRNSYVSYENIEELDSSGNKINKINKIIKEKDGSMKRNRYHHGFIAQDIEKLIKDTNTDFGGFQDNKINGGEDQLSLSHNEFICPMVKAIQELSNQNASLIDRISKLELFILNFKPTL